MLRSKSKRGKKREKEKEIEAWDGEGWARGEAGKGGGGGSRRGGGGQIEGPGLTGIKDFRLMAIPRHTRSESALKGEYRNTHMAVFLGGSV